MLERDDVPLAQSRASTQRDGEAAGGGVERRAGAHDAAADHDDVELPRPHGDEGGVPLLRPQAGARGPRHEPLAGSEPVLHKGAAGRTAMAPA